jgi:hypothetical protein
MPSRIGSIIVIADTKSKAMLDAFPDGSKMKSNNEAIIDICRALVSRRTPLLPTAKLVSEEGGKTNPHFPLERTIFNSYNKAIRIWKKAYYDVMNINADSPLAVNDVERIDTSVMNSPTADLVDRLKEIVSETTQRCNVLKQIIDEGVPVPGHGLMAGIDTDEIMTDLRDWLQGLSTSAFQLDDFGVKVSRKTPPGTKIMDGRLFDGLRTFTDDYERVRKTHRTNDAV